MRLTRRRLFRLFLAGPASLAAQEVSKPKLIIRSARPEDFEMPLDGFSTWITPAERFFVRTHLYNPSIDIRNWRLEITGEAGRPASLRLEDLKKLPRVELVSVLECAGNGRAFYQPTVPGQECGWLTCCEPRIPNQPPGMSRSMEPTCRSEPCLISCAPFQSRKPCIRT